MPSGGVAERLHQLTEGLALDCLAVEGRVEQELVD